MFSKYILEYVESKEFTSSRKQVEDDPDYLPEDNTEEELQESRESMESMVLVDDSSKCLFLLFS